MKRFLLLTMVTIMTASMVACGGDNTQSYNADTYEITTAGHNGDMKVAVTFTETEISKVEVIEHLETEGISDEAINTLPENIVSEQSTEVDSISGATVSSEAVKKAVNEAIKEASK